MARKKNSQQLLDKVIENLKKDISYGDVTVLEELLTYIPKKYLIGALDEEEWQDYTKDVKKMYDLENESINDQREKAHKKAKK